MLDELGVSGHTKPETHSEGRAVIGTLEEFFAERGR